MRRRYPVAQVPSHGALHAPFWWGPSKPVCEDPSSGARAEGPCASSPRHVVPLTGDDANPGIEADDAAPLRPRRPSATLRVSRNGGGESCPSTSSKPLISATECRAFARRAVHLAELPSKRRATASVEGLSSSTSLLVTRTPSSSWTCRTTRPPPEWRSLSGPA